MAAIQMAPDSLASSELASLHSSDTTPDFADDSPTPTEPDMSEEQLRELYDNEEVERFLYLFSAVSISKRTPLKSTS